MRAFAPANVELMTIVVDERLAPEAERDERALAQRLADHLASSESDVWVRSERTEYLAMLQGAVAPGAKAADAGPTSSAAAAPSEPELPGVSEADRARLGELDRVVDARRWDEARATITDLGRAYPDSFPVQEKVCKIAMRLRMTARDLEAHCDRMMQLSMPQPAAK
jgi:hypothetical protein